MKILILCKKFPYPLTEGEPIAISYLSKALVEVGCEVSLLVLNASKHYFDPKMLPSENNYFSEIHSISVNNHITWMGAAKALVRGESYILSRFHAPLFAAKLKELLLTSQYDVVQLETIYMAHYLPIIRANSKAIIVLRSHNVEHLIWERVAARSGFFKKWYLRHQNGFLKKFEIERTKQCDLLAAITATDLATFRNRGFNGQGLSIPVGLDLAKYRTDFSPGTDKQSIAFIGALDWMPNQDGIIWFLENVWPDVAARFPKMELHIAGKNTPDWLFQKSTDRVRVHGEVPDAKAFVSQHPVMVVPLFAGSGIKVKVLEGMALGRAIVTTSVGIEGIPATHQVHLFVADTKDAFLDAICRCFAQNADTLDMRRKAVRLIESAFEPIQLAKKLKQAYTGLLAAKPQ